MPPEGYNERMHHYALNDVLFTSFLYNMLPDDEEEEINSETGEPNVIDVSFEVVESNITL